MTDSPLQIEAIKAFSDNYIWLITAAGNNDCFVVDPGDASPVMETLEARNLNLAGILVTHHHADHTGGIPELLQHFDARIYGPANSSIRFLTDILKDGDAADVLGHPFQVLSVPGHTLDHIAYFSPQQFTLFCGDTLFSGGCGRLFEGTPQQMYDSLHKFRQLPDSTRVFCAHEYTASNLKFAIAVEPDNQDIADYIVRVEQLRRQDIPTIPTSIGLEKRINPFLRTSDNTVILCAGNRLNVNAPDQKIPEPEVLRVIREWKDNFQ
ncbi:hydroxyacylglutathione hydrolase [Endozoicomonas gorgoniicola]|uniref:Hydroxyacylglutathione hydrolase n=1 Tax=Endozoicomonas gorgoniicola TaxID=1234144 RepID=A0ABT3MT20_9GAMM|nr:hydroxyacylglutathione hydrolase [Endozoicomonas gorgoniicola]MCW7552531.1 hydroxyacylglutathione hydrolase [Endozoicomonas gorgoniicola]